MLQDSSRFGPNRKPKAKAPEGALLKAPALDRAPGLPPADRWG